MQNAISIPAPALAYAHEVRARLGSHVKKIILFGSQARGDAHPGSDYDFVVVLDEKSRSLREAVVDAGAAVMLNLNQLCAAIVYGESQWEKVAQTPLGWNIAREGILL